MNGMEPNWTELNLLPNQTNETKQQPNEMKYKYVNLFSLMHQIVYSDTYENACRFSQCAIYFSTVKSFAFSFVFYI